MYHGSVVYDWSSSDGRGVYLYVGSTYTTGTGTCYVHVHYVLDFRHTPTGCSATMPQRRRGAAPNVGRPAFVDATPPTTSSTAPQTKKPPRGPRWLFRAASASAGGRGRRHRRFGGLGVSSKSLQPYTYDPSLPSGWGRFHGGLRFNRDHALVPVVTMACVYAHVYQWCVRRLLPGGTSSPASYQ